MPQTLTIDASGMTGKSFNQNTYFDEFFEGLTYDDNTFYGGTPDSAFGGSYYVNGSEVVNRYTDGTDPVEHTLILEGTEIAYDFIHHGAEFGHGISGEVTGLVFGRWMDGTTSGTEGTGDAGRVSGFNENVVIDGLDVSAAPGSGNEPGENPVNALYSAAQDMDASVFTALFADYALEVTGTRRNDRLEGSDHDDVLMGGAGGDTLARSSGDDIMIGGRGDDLVLGGGGWDTLAGGAGDDVLKGGRGRDTITGGSGDDTLVGGPGFDTLTGGAGADTFVILAGAKGEKITDFDVDADVLDVTDLGLSSLDDFAVIERDAKIVLVDDNVRIHLIGVEVEDLTADHFIF